jgi:hypothetical protein
MTPQQIEDINAFLGGIIVMGHATAGLFFVRFWKKTHDRLFVLFAIAFWILGLTRVVMLFWGEMENEHVLYWFRFIAYLIILLAILDKNFRK